MAEKKTEAKAQPAPLTDEQMLAQMEARKKARTAAVLRVFLEQGLRPVAQAPLPGGGVIILNTFLGEMSPEDRAEIAAQLATLEK
jgi:hypothetical protein